MIEFLCKNCKTILSLGAEQTGDTVYCPACGEELSAPTLDSENQAILAINLAQMRKKDKFHFDPQKFKKIFREPPSPETMQWKRALAKSFKAAIPDSSCKFLKTS